MGGCSCKLPILPILQLTAAWETRIAYAVIQTICPKAKSEVPLSYSCWLQNFEAITEHQLT